jgi:hypothetical protein
MADSIPGFRDIVESEETQLWASGPDNQHKRYLARVVLKSSITDSGNTSNTTTIRGGNVIGVKASDGLGYLYDADATDGTQVPVGLVPVHLSMLNSAKTAVEDKQTRLLTQGILKNVDDLLGDDLSVLASLFRMGFTLGTLEPHGSQFGLHFKGRYFHTADYTILAADHGTMRVAHTNAVNFTLPDLATVGRGFQVYLYNGVAASMVITGAANTIAVGDAGGALSTTITFSTANEQMGGAALMYADYASDGGSLVWYSMFNNRTFTTA